MTIKTCLKRVIAMSELYSEEIKGFHKLNKKEQYVFNHLIISIQNALGEQDVDDLCKKLKTKCYEG